MKTTNCNNIESKNAVYNAIIEAIKGDRMIGRHIAQTYGTNGPRPVYGIEVWESIVYVHTDTDRRIFDKAIDRLLKAHEDLFKWADFQKASEEGPHIVLALTDEIVKAKSEAEKAIREAEKAKATDSIESCERTIISRAKQDKQARHYYNGYEVRVRKAYTNGSSDPKDWTYCVSWYADGQLVECENGVRLAQAAKALNDLPRWAEARKTA